MTQDEIIEMAREAGCVEDKHYKGEVIFISNDALERFAKLVAAKEREDCALICDELVNEENSEDYQNAANWCSVRIRVRGNEA